MTLQPLIQTPFIIQFHVILALYCILSGPFAVFRKCRDRAHKIIGHSSVLAMSLVSFSSFWIQEIKVFGPFSPIHILSLATLIVLYQGVRLVHQRRFSEHSRQMKMLYLFSLCLPGLFTLLPGRRMSDVLFADFPWLGFNLMAAVLVTAETWWNSAAPKLSRQ